MRQVATDQDRRVRRVELEAEDRQREAQEAAAQEKARTSNKNFTQVYPKGWARIRELINTNPSAAKLYTFLAEHMQGSEGAVVVSQEVMAEALGVHVITIKRHSKFLENQGALVRIRVGTGVYAYALDPSEVWKTWDDKKELAAFATRTLVLKRDRQNGQVRRKLAVMMGESKAGSDVIKDPRQTDLEDHLTPKSLAA